MIGQEVVDESPATQWPASQGVPLLINAVRLAHDYDTVNDPSMHACPRDMVMTGLHIGRNAFLCARLQRKGAAQVLGRYQVVRSGMRGGAIACPRGSALAGLHVGAQILLCVELHLCRQDDHCLQGNRCRAKDAQEQADGLYCRQPGLIVLMKDLNCQGDLVDITPVGSGRLNSNMRGRGDKAASAIYIGVRAGTVFEYFDKDSFQTDDDFASVRNSSTISTGCLNDLEMRPSRRIDASPFQGRVAGSGNLATKVSSYRFFSTIGTGENACLGRRVTSDDRGPDRLVVQSCSLPAVQRWYRENNGTIRLDGTPNRCLSAWRFSREDGAPQGVLGEAALVDCGPPDATDIQDHLRWSNTAEGQLRVFTNYCLTRNGTATPIIEPCRFPIPPEQVWRANF